MNGKLDGNVKQEQEQEIAQKVARGQLGAVEIYWEKLEVNLTQNGLPQLQIYTTLPLLPQCRVRAFVYACYFDFRLIKLMSALVKWQCTNHFCMQRVKRDQLHS